MEEFSLSHRRLQVLAANFWNTAEQCQVILSDIGVDSIRISLAEPSIMRWFRILTELIKRDDGSMQRLVIVLMKDYPDNKTLRDICAPWIPAKPATAPAPEKQAANVPAGAVLVKEFIEDDGPIVPVIKRRTKPSPTDDFLPLVASPDFADEADVIVPKLETLWDAMTATNEQLLEIIERLEDMEKWRGAPATQRTGKKP